MKWKGRFKIHFVLCIERDSDFTFYGFFGFFFKAGAAPNLDKELLDWSLSIPRVLFSESGITSFIMEQITAQESHTTSAQSSHQLWPVPGLSPRHGPWGCRCWALPAPSRGRWHSHSTGTFPRSWGSTGLLSAHPCTEVPGDQTLQDPRAGQGQGCQVRHCSDSSDCCASTQD